MLSFSSWQIKVNGIKNLFLNLDKSADVWRGEDGSILVGDAANFGPEYEDTEYIQDGKVSDWLED